MLDEHHRNWANIKPVSGERLLFSRKNLYRPLFVSVLQFSIKHDTSLVITNRVIFGEVKVASCEVRYIDVGWIKLE